MRQPHAGSNLSDGLSHLHGRHGSGDNPAVQTSGTPRPAAAVVSTTGGWAVVAVLAVAPVLTGTRMPWSVRAVEAMVAVAVGLRATGAALAGRRWPAVPVVPAVAVVLLLVQGWGMTAIPRSAYDRATRRLTMTPATAANGDLGTVDADTSVEAMGRATAVIALFAAACGMARDRQWVRRAYAGLAVGGVFIVGLGLLRRAGVTVDPFDPPANEDGTAFGPFAYHGTAGAFLNLAISGALACVAVDRRTVARTAAVVAAAVCVGGAFVNVSRAGQVLTGVTLLAWGVWAWTTTGGRGRVPRWAWAAAAVIVAGIIAVGGGRAWHRWQSVGSQLTVDSPRPTLWRICGGLARHAGPFGFGPGSFKLLLPDAARHRHAVREVDRDPVRAGDAGPDLVQRPPGPAASGDRVGLGRGRRVGRRGRRRAARRPQPRPAGRTPTFAAVVAVAVVGAHATMDFPLQIFCLDLAVAVVLAVAWVETSSDR